MTTAKAEAAARRIRRLTVEMIAAAGAGHPGSSLSVVEVLAALHYGVMRWYPDVPDHPDRDRFFLSKGHAAPALYALLIDAGVLPAEQLPLLRQHGSMLQGHPDPRFTRGVEFPSGSLAQGFSAATGAALGLARTGRSERVFAVVGDGECQEGQVWEAAQFAAHQQLDNLTVVVDDNGLQHDAPVAEIGGAGDLAARWAACGWAVRVVDGHNVGALVAACAARTAGVPGVVLARTVKGKGVPFMENQVHWHSVHDTARLPDAVAAVGGGA